MKTDKTQYVIFTEGLPYFVTGEVPEYPALNWDFKNAGDYIAEYEKAIAALERIPVAEEFHDRIAGELYDIHKIENNKLYRLSEPLEYRIETRNDFTENWGVREIKVAILIDSKEPEPADERKDKWRRESWINSVMRVYNKSREEAEADYARIFDSKEPEKPEDDVCCTEGNCHCSDHKSPITIKVVEKPKESEEELWREVVVSTLDIQDEQVAINVNKNKFTITRK